MAELNINLGCPDCRGDLYLVEPGGCRAAFLYFVFLIGIPIVVGNIAHSLNSNLNLWSWMVDSFPNNVLQGFFHLVVVVLLSGLLSVLIVRKILNKTLRKQKYLQCRNCSRKFLKGPGKGTVIPI